MIKFTMRIPDKVHKAVKMNGVEKEISMTDVILNALKKDKVITQDQIDSE